VAALTGIKRAPPNRSASWPIDPDQVSRDGRGSNCAQPETHARIPIQEPLMKFVNARSALILALFVGIAAAVTMIAYAGSQGPDAPAAPQPALMSIPF
jgi:hypothetical protein